MSEAALEACTVLAVGARGKLRGAAFALESRTCVKSTRGGIWNEWTVAFDDGRTAFLSEAVNGFTLFFEEPIAPPFEALAVGTPMSTPFVVVERGEARRIARWGASSGGGDGAKTYRYADLSAPDGRRATVDYGSGSALPSVFVGHVVRLGDLGLSPRKERARFVPVRDTPRPKGLETWLDIGDEGTLGDPSARYRVIGIVQRSIRIEGERYTWEEYVLHAPAEGIRWLVVSDGHWSFVRTIEGGEVTEVDEVRALYRGTKHRFYSGGKAKVEWAAGELPWELAVGDSADVADYVSAPHVLSRESTTDEITWSYGTYTEAGTVARAFGKRVLPKAAGRAPHQPQKRR